MTAKEKQKIQFSFSLFFPFFIFFPFLVYVSLQVRSHIAKPGLKNDLICSQECPLTFDCLVSPNAGVTGLCHLSQYSISFLKARDTISRFQGILLGLERQHYAFNKYLVIKPHFYLKTYTIAQSEGKDEQGQRFFTHTIYEIVHTKNISEVLRIYFESEQ